MFGRFINGVSCVYGAGILVTGYYVKPFTPDPDIQRLVAVKEQFPELTWETINRYYSWDKLMMSVVFPGVCTAAMTVSIYERGPSRFHFRNPALCTELKYPDEHYLNVISNRVISTIDSTKSISRLVF